MGVGSAIWCCDDFTGCGWSAWVKLVNLGTEFGRDLEDFEHSEVLAMLACLFLKLQLELR